MTVSTALTDHRAALKTRFFALVATILALIAAQMLFPPYRLGWGCQPTWGSVSLVLIWLLPAISGVRELTAQTPRALLVASALLLAGVSVSLGWHGEWASALTATACR
jgi:hypothetical protein